MPPLFHFQIRTNRYFTLQQFTLGACLSFVLLIAVVELLRYYGLILSSYLEQVPMMKRITAVCFIVGATALFQLHADARNYKQFQRYRTFASLFLGFTGLATILLYIYNNYFHFSGFFKSLRFLEDIFHWQPMNVFTALNFVGISVVLFLLNRKGRRTGIVHIIILPVAAISLFFILGFVFGVKSIAHMEIVPFSPATGMSFLFICTAILFVLPKSWLMSTFTATEFGGVIARRIIIPTLILPLIFGWLRIQGERSGLIQSEEGIILVALCYMMTAIIMIWFIAQYGNKIDRLRRISDNALIKSNQRLALLSDIAGKLLATDHPQTIVDELCNRVMNHLDCQVFFNFLKDEKSDQIYLNACAGISDSEKEAIKWLDGGTSVCGCVAINGQRIIAEDIQNQPESQTDLVRSFGIKAYACHPLISNNKTIGTLSFGTRNREHFYADEISLMKVVADQVAIAMARIIHENELKESENRFRTIAQSLPVLVAISRKSDAKVIFANEIYERSFGYEPGTIVGLKAHDLYYNPEDRDALLRMLEEKQSLNNYEVRVKRMDGSDFWVLSSVRPIMFDGTPSFLSAMLDITDRKKAQDEMLHMNRTLDALRKSGQIMMHSTDEEQYLSEVCKIIIESGHLMVWIGYAMDDEEKSVKPVAFSGFDEGYIDHMKISWGDNERGRGPTGTAIRTGKPSICRDMLNDPNFAPWRTEAAKRGFASSVVLPLLTNGKPFGSISIYSKLPDAFAPSEVDLLNDLADDLSYGIMNIRLAEQERKAAKIIRESETKYRQLFEGMVEGFMLAQIIIDAEGHPEDFKIISVNPAYENQSGLKASDVLDRNMKDILPALEAYWVEVFGKVALTGETIEIENYSNELNRYFKGSVFCPEYGYFAVIFENITDQILARQELNKTKNYLENLINYANAPIIVWNNQLEIQLFNHAFERLTGYTAAETEGQNLEILFPGESRSESYDKILAAYTANLETMEIPIITKNKEVRTVLWNSANIYDPDNHTIISTIAQGNDITERIRAEHAVLNAMEKLDLALENANIGIWEWDVEPDIIRLDEKIIRMTCIQEELELKMEAFERFIHEDDIPHFKRAIRKAFLDDTPFDTIFRVGQSSNYKYINAKARVGKNVTGSPVRMAGVFIDITEMKQHTDQTLFTLNEDLMRSNKELEQFAYVASHDLQEPLRMISSFTQLLARKYTNQLDAEAHEFIKFAVDGASRMQTLINDLLEFSRIKTRGKTPVDVDMQEVLGQTIHNLSMRIKEKNALITSDSLPVIQADPGQMVQLLQNLIDNALKFCKDLPLIHISVHEEQHQYVFMVKDNGIGIDAQYYDRIFQIFQRLHLKNEYEGTGIGLAICRRIAERHGGKIWVEHNVEKGSMFKFTIKK